MTWWTSVIAYCVVAYKGDYVIQKIYKYVSSDNHLKFIQNTMSHYILFFYCLFEGIIFCKVYCMLQICLMYVSNFLLFKI